jgi:hypothetical protein
MLHIHHHLSSWAGAIGQLVADSQISLTSPQGTKRKLTIWHMKLKLSSTGRTSCAKANSGGDCFEIRPGDRIFVAFLSPQEIPR